VGVKPHPEPPTRLQSWNVAPARTNAPFHPTAPQRRRHPDLLDQARLPPDGVQGLAIAEGLEQINRQALSLGLSAVAAGLILGFTTTSVSIGTEAVRSSRWRSPATSSAAACSSPH